MEQIRDLVIRAARAINKDERIAAYGGLVERFRDMACGYAYSLLGDFHLAEDAAQDAFVTAYRTLDQLRQPEAFPGWFRRIVWSACGRISRQKAVPMAGIDAAEDLPIEQDDPSTIAEKAEMRDEVLRAISQLPAQEREVTTLFYINGYSQKDIADFLEVPVGTVKNRLTASRGRLKERMLNMVKDTLHKNAPDERFDRKVIEQLLTRPNLLEIDGHPVQKIWEAIRAALAEYEVVDPGSELEDQATAKAAEDHAWEEFAYRAGAGKALRFQMTSVTMSAIVGRKPPVQIMAAGRVFRPDKEDATHYKVFHQVDGVCIETGADEAAYRSVCERALKAAVPGAAVEWRQYPNTFVVPYLGAILTRGGRSCEALGGGVLQAKTLANKGYDPESVSGFAWGLSLDRLAMLQFGIDDIRKLWQTPFIR